MAHLVIISSMVLFFNRDNCGAGPAVDAPRAVETLEAPLPAPAVAVEVAAAGTDKVCVVPLVASVVFGANKLGTEADVVVLEADVEAGAVVVLGLPKLLKSEDV